jgi:siroheme synthase (precorrin-2 oxidase/ferrochelatase)
MAEGTQEPSVAALIGGGDVTERRVFSRLWAKINGVESWGANPWVYAITFHRVEAP